MGKNDQGHVAEEWFNQYLSERGYQWQEEPAMGTARNPDRLITTSGHLVVAEVKSFATDGLLKNAIFSDTGTEGIRVSQPMSRDSKDALAPIRKKIKEAAGQLKELGERGWPLIIVLANPLNKPIPLNEPNVVSAMYGDLTAQGTLGPDGKIAEWVWAAGRNGKLRNDHKHVSAVAILHHRHHAQDWADGWFDENRKRFGAHGTAAMLKAFQADAHQAPQGSYVWLTIFETLSETAAPLPRDIFNGPRDVRYVPDDDRTALVPLTAPDRS